MPATTSRTTRLRPRRHAERREVRLPSGPVRYRDLGAGAARLRPRPARRRPPLGRGRRRPGAGYRCLVPDWPMGSHRRAMNPAADLSPPGMARSIADFLDGARARRVTMVGNDTGGAISQMLIDPAPGAGRAPRADQLRHARELPAVPFKLMPPLARLPGGMTALAAPFRIGALRARDLRDARQAPDPTAPGRRLARAGARRPRRQRDPRKLTAGMHKRHTLEAAEQLRQFERPVLLAWAPMTASSSSPTRSGWRPRSRTRGSRRSTTRGPSSRSTSRRRSPSDRQLRRRDGAVRLGALRPSRRNLRLLFRRPVLRYVWHERHPAPSPALGEERDEENLRPGAAEELHSPRA